MRSFAPLAFAAISGVVLWQLWAMILLPVLAVVFGMMGTVLKLALIGGMIFAVYSVIKKRREAAEA